MLTVKLHGYEYKKRVLFKKVVTPVCDLGLDVVYFDVYHGTTYHERVDFTIGGRYILKKSNDGWIYSFKYYRHDIQTSEVVEATIPHEYFRLFEDNVYRSIRSPETPPPLIKAHVLSEFVVREINIKKELTIPTGSIIELYDGGFFWGYPLENMYPDKTGYFIVASHHAELIT